MDGWVNGGGGPGQINKNQINLEVIKIIQFCLKIYETHPAMGGFRGGCVHGWVNGWAQVKSLNIK